MTDNNMTSTMTTSYQKFGVIGAGAWGTALALCMRRAGRDVVVWAKDPAVAADINQKHENTKRLRGVQLDDARCTPPVR